MSITNWLDRVGARTDAKDIVDILCGFKEIIGDIQKIINDKIDSVMASGQDIDLIRECLSLTWHPSMYKKDFESVEKILNVYTRYVCTYPLRSTKHGLQFTDEYMRVEKYIFPFSKKLMIEAYSILNQRKELIRHLMDNGLACYKYSFNCVKCERNCENGIVIEKEIDDIPTVAHAFVLLSHDLKEKKIKLDCCLCKGLQEKCVNCNTK